MKKAVFIFLLTALAAAACSSNPTPAPTATQAATAAATEVKATVVPTIPATAAPTETEVPAEQAADGKVQVQVSEGDNWIKSDIATFKVGVPYVFTVTNMGRRAHIFSISNPVTNVTASGMDAAKSAALVFVSQDELTPGEVVTVEYTFTDPAPDGTLEFACLILMHYKMGQFLPIVVE